MPQDHARFVDRDGAPEDAVLAALVPLRVRPGRELFAGRRMPERDGTLPHDETQHDPQRLDAVVHSIRVSHGLRSAVKHPVGLTHGLCRRH